MITQFEFALNKRERPAGRVGEKIIYKRRVLTYKQWAGTHTKAGRAPATRQVAGQQVAAGSLGGCERRWGARRRAARRRSLGPLSPRPAPSGRLIGQQNAPAEAGGERPASHPSGRHLGLVDDSNSSPDGEMRPPSTGSRSVGRPAVRPATIRALVRVPFN